MNSLRVISYVFLPLLWSRFSCLYTCFSFFFFPFVPSLGWQRIDAISVAFSFFWVSFCWWRLERATHRWHAVPLRSPCLVVSYPFFPSVLSLFSTLLLELCTIGRLRAFGRVFGFWTNVISHRYAKQYYNIHY